MVLQAFGVHHDANGSFLRQSKYFVFPWEDRIDFWSEKGFSKHSIFSPKHYILVPEYCLTVHLLVNSSQHLTAYYVSALEMLLWRHFHILHHYLTN